MSILRILAPSAEEARFDWVRLDAAQQVLAQGGEAQLAYSESDAEVELILAAERVLFIPVQVSAEQFARLTEENLPWLAEPDLVQEVERLHIVRCGRVQEGILNLCVVEHAWLARMISRLAEKQIRPTRIIPEAMISREKAGLWSVILKAAGGFVRTGSMEGFILDQGKDDEIPAILGLAVKSGKKPEEIVVYCDQMSSPNLGKWASQLGVLVRCGGDWKWYGAIPADCVNLASGPYAPPGRVRDLLRRMKPSLWLLAAILILNGLGLLAATGLRQLEKRRLDSAIEAELRNAFPNTKAILDPLLQMRQNVERVNRNAGELTSSDFLPLLGRVSTVLGKDITGNVETIRYDLGVLVLELSLPDADRLAKLKRDAAALAVKWENLPTTSGGAVRVRMSVSS